MQTIEITQNTYILQSLQKEMERRGEGPSQEFFPCRIKRPGVGILDREDGSWVMTTNQLVKLFSQVEEVVEESTYVGADHEDVIVLRCKLPSSFEGRIAYIRYRHLPANLRKAQDAVVIRDMNIQDNELGEPDEEPVLFCRSLKPVSTRAQLGAISGARMDALYGYITVKIKKSTQTFLGWVPGIDVNTDVCASGRDKFVLLGLHYGVYSKRK